MDRERIEKIVRHLVLLVSVVPITAGCLATIPDAQAQRKMLPGGTFKMKDLTREELTERAGPLGSPVHTALEKPGTLVERISTPFFADGAIYHVSTRPPDRPRLYVLGVWGKDGIALLNNKPDAFFEVAANSRLNLVSSSDYVAYVIAFLQSTRDFLGGPQILKTIEESWWLPSPTPEEAKKREEVTAKYAKVVEAPKLSPEADSTVIVYAIIDRKLLRLSAKVETGGRIQISENVLEAEMPTVMLR